MNTRQLKKLDVPPDCMNAALRAIAAAGKDNRWRKENTKRLIKQIVASPASFKDDEHFADFAQALIEEAEFTRPEPIDFKIWGRDHIDDASIKQMRKACSLPMAQAGALMPDAHVGYGLPIGGVLALENAVCPYAVGVDIACRMKLSVFDMPVNSLADKDDLYRDALEEGTVFGVGKSHDQRQTHDVMDKDWSVTKVTRLSKDKAWKQLGSSGSGNHFVEFGVFRISERQPDIDLEPGEYVSLLSHSGSRGTGAAVCSHYSDVARSKLPQKYEGLGRLAWLDMNTQAGGEYWAAMNLMGDYAAANHAVIHRRVADLLGAETIAVVENHHNFAWKETHDGREVYVHRKGATPAGKGVLGVIPGSMQHPAYVVRGKGNPASLDSASHGAGRVMSRRKAKDLFNFKAIKNDLAKKGITILSAGADEVPNVYKDIDLVMAEQQDLVETVARFDPRIIKMCDDGSRAED